MFNLKILQGGLLALVSLGLTACSGLSHGIHEGGLYSLESETLLKVLPEVEALKMRPPVRLMDTKTPMGTAYQLIKVEKLGPEQVALKVFQQQSELLPSAERIHTEDLEKMPSIPETVSRKSFDETVAPHLLWVMDAR
jgi:hypothetical protein